MPSSRSNLSIQPAAPSQRAEALLLLLSDSPPADRTRQAAALLSAARAGVVSLDHLLVATDGRKISGAVWANPLSGGLAAMWPPQVRDSGHQTDGADHSSADDRLALALVTAAEQRVRQAAEVSLWQASLELEAIDSQRRLAAAGYRPLAVLTQMVAVPAAECPSTSTGPLRFVPYEAEDFARLCQTIEATYVATLDCPELDALRTTADCVSGYRAIGNSAAGYWRFVQYDGYDVGCLLLAEHEAGQFELVYMGLNRECRGRGWGRLLVAEALQMAAEQGATALLTAVDRRNRPAISVYHQAGFTAWGDRQIMIKQGG